MFDTVMNLVKEWNVTGICLRLALATFVGVIIGLDREYKNKGRAEWLLASMARPDNIQYTDCLTLSSKYRWMEEDAEPVSRLRLRERFSKRAEYDRIK